MSIIITEDDAAKTWCPHVHSPEMLMLREELLTGTRPSKVPMPRCIGSSCMNWFNDGMSHDMDDGQLEEGDEPAVPTGRCGLSNRER